MISRYIIKCSLLFYPYNTGFNLVRYAFLWSQFGQKKAIFESRKAENVVIDSRCPESNWGPFDYESNALPTELHRPEYIRPGEYKVTWAVKWNFIILPGLCLFWISPSPLYGLALRLPVSWKYSIGVFRNRDKNQHGRNGIRYTGGFNLF